MTVRAVLGILPPDATRLDIGITLDRLAYDPASPSAIAGAVRAARSGARTVREVISGEMWECLNVTALTLPRQRKAAELRYRYGPRPDACAVWRQAGSFEATGAESAQAPLRIRECRRSAANTPDLTFQ